MFQPFHFVYILSSIATTMEQLIEISECLPKRKGEASEELLNRDEVKQFLDFIDEIKIDPSDYTAKKWREIIAKPDHLLGFGKPGDWYQYVLQQRNILSSILEFDQTNPFLKHIELLNLVKSNSGWSPNAYDWDMVNESFELDEPKFNIRETNLRFKVNTSPDDEYVTIQVHSKHWDRYSSEGNFVSKCGKISASVVQSNEPKFQSFTGLVVLNHDVTNVTYDDKTPNRLARLSITFFTTLASLLKVSKESIVKFIFDACQYPFTKCSWKSKIEHIEAENFDWNEDKYKRVIDEINEKMPNVIQIFKEGYTEINDHVNLLDDVLELLLRRVRNVHCRRMMFIALKEDRYFDFSAAIDLVANTHWQYVTNTTSSYDINIFDSEDRFEFSMHVEWKFKLDYCDRLKTKCRIFLLNIESQEMQQKFRETFQPYIDDYTTSEYGDSFVKIFEADPSENIDFQVTFFIDHLLNHSDDERSVLLEIMELMHLNWSVDQFWKFLVEMSMMEEELTPRNEDCWQPQFWESYTDFGIQEDNVMLNGFDSDSEYHSGDSADDGEDTLMDLDQELNDIKMEVDPELATRGRLCLRKYVQKSKNPPQPQRQKATLNKEKSQLRRDLSNTVQQ